MTTAKNTDVLRVEHVQADYFLDRVRQFEVKYGQSWIDFWRDYSAGNKDRENTDYEEWAFICTHFSNKLLEQMEDEGDPPPGRCRVSDQKPEPDSGFCIFGVSPCSTQNNITKRSISAWHRATATSFGIKMQSRYRRGFAFGQTPLNSRLGTD